MECRLVHWDYLVHWDSFFVCSVCSDIFACADWFVLIFPSVCFLQGARALSTFGGRFTDPELSRLASSLPLRCLGAKADSTTERYSRAFEKFRVWAASYKEISVLPTNVLHVLTSK